MQAMLYCQACGAECHDRDKRCRSCKAKLDYSLKTMDSPSEPITEKAFSAENDAVAGNFCLIGGALIAIGSFFPYVVVTSMLGISISRNAFQLGQNLSMTYEGPLIVAAGLLLALRGLNLKGTLGAKRPSGWSPIWASIFGALVVANAWMSTLPVSSAVTFNRGYGGIVSFVGTLFGFVAVYIRRRNT